jgi:curved DNA-binding protein CbpA
MEADPYSVLGLSWGASDQDIRRAFRRLTFLHHPDRNPGDAKAARRFALISAAYQRLKESGWTLPYDATASSTPRDPADHSSRWSYDEPYVRPERWPDGTPIYYPTPEEIAALDHEPLFAPLRRLRQGVLPSWAIWIVRAVLYLYVAMMAFGVLLFIFIVVWGIYQVIGGG